MAARTLLETSHGYVGTVYSLLLFLASRTPVHHGVIVSQQGMYAGEVGVPRLLKLFEKYGIKTTWFIPHVLRSYNS